MKIRLTLILLFCFQVMVISQTEIRPWEKLGISQTEWMMIQENNMPMGKVEELLIAGIGISEYFTQPWIALDLSESKWIAKRRSGLTNEDMENDIRRPKRDNSWKEGNKEIIRNDMKAISGSGQRFSSLFLPGYQQHKTGRHLTGNIMIGLCSGAIIYCGIQSIRAEHFQGIPVFGIIIPTMVWSLIDYTIYSKKADN